MGILNFKIKNNVEFMAFKITSFIGGGSNFGFNLATKNNLYIGGKNLRGK